MKKTLLLLAIITFASCKKVYTCHCQANWGTGYSSETNTLRARKSSDAKEKCQQIDDRNGLAACEVSEAK